MRSKLSKWTVASGLLLALVLAVGSCGPRSHDRAQSEFEGTWKEFWGVPGETDVTYHDMYRVSVAGDQVFIEVNGDAQTLRYPAIFGSRLTFEQQTSFAVRYSLELSDDANEMNGTATTPEGQYPIRWERVQ